jgi:O-antigen/teichoic acid export membrane protein
MYIFGTLLTANASLKILNILALIALITNFGLNLLLIPKYQALGAAYAAIITQTFIGITNCYFAYKVLKLEFNKVIFLKLLMLFIMLCIVALLCKTYTISLLVSLTILCLIGGSSIFVFKLLDIKQLANLAKSKFN